MSQESAAGKNFLMKMGLKTGTVAHVRDIICVADVAGSLRSKYVTLMSPPATPFGLPKKFRFYFVVGSVGVAPDDQGATLVPVAIALNDTASTVATALEAAIDAQAEFTSTVATATITVTNAYMGEIEGEGNGTPSPGFTFSAPATVGVSVESFNVAGGLQTHSLTINNEAIEKTNYGSKEWRELIADAGVRQFSASGSGIFTASTNEKYALQCCLSGKLVNLRLVDDVTGDTFIAAFKITSMEYSGEYNAARTYSMSLEATGEVILDDAA